MKIQIGNVQLQELIREGKTEMIPNKTRKYLLPCFKEYGDEFTKKVNSIYKIAVGIGDMIIVNSGVKVYEQHLFVLVNTDIAKDYFIEFIDWIKDQSMYEDDYVFGNINKSTLHMIVIKIPAKFNESINQFRRGKYTKMFDKEAINSFFKNNPDAKMVFVKDKNYKVVFTDKVNHIYNTNINPEDWEPDELELPPTERSDIFNHHLKKKK